MKYAIFTSVFMLSILVQASNFCTVAKVPPAYTKMTKEVDKAIGELGKNKVIAAQADAILSKLIAAKSPVISSWMGKRDMADKSETQIVLEWRQYYARNFVLTKYPQEDEKINQATEKLVDKILSKNLDQKFKKRLEKLFATAQRTSVEAIQSFRLEEEVKIISRIQEIKLYWPKDLKSARNNAIPMDLIDWGIAYDPAANEINVGVGALAYPDDETYLAVFAHEIGHSFDSCRWGAFFEGKWPFEKVGECLRSNKSVSAKKRDDSSLEALIKAGKIPADLAMGLKQNPTCNKLTYPPSGQQADQLPESFADWFSAEVVARLPKVDGKILRADLCEEKTLIEGSSYPTNALRLERIFLAQPKIRATLKNVDSLAGEYCPLR